MSTRRKFLKNGILLCAVGLSSRTVALIMGAFISRTIGAEGIGLNSLVMNVYTFALTFATAGIQLTVTALVAGALGEGKRSDTSRILRGAFSYALIFSTAATLALLFLSGALSRHVIGDSRVSGAVNILAFSLIPAALSAVISGYFVGMRHVSLNAAVGVVGQTARVVLTVLLLLRYKDGGTHSAIFALALGVTLTELCVFALSMLEFIIDRFVGKFDGQRGFGLKDVSVVAMPLALSAYVRSALLTLEHSLIPKRLRLYGQDGGESLASYGYIGGMALPLLLYPMVPLSAFSSLLVPEFAEARAGGGFKRMEYIASRALTLTLSYAICAAVLFFTFSEELGYVVYGSYNAGHYIALLAPVVPIMYLDHVADNMLKGIGEQVYSMWVNIIDSFLSVCLVFVLIPIFGISGYAFVIVGMEAFNFLLSAVRLKKRVSFKIDFIRAVIMPLLSMGISSFLVKSLFRVRGAEVDLRLLIFEGVFTLSSYFALMLILKPLFSRRYKSASKATISPKPSKRA